MNTSECEIANTIHRFRQRAEKALETGDTEMSAYWIGMIEELTGEIK